MPKVFYKVVYPLGGRLVSCRAHNFGLDLEYKPGEWTLPVLPNSRLFIFEHLSDAESFRHAWDGEQIYECNAIGVVRGRGVNSDWLIRDFWKTIIKYNRLHNFKKAYAKALAEVRADTAKYDALLAKKVRLTKLVG